MVKHETPEELDKFFEREEISPEEYADFWERWWSTEEGSPLERALWSLSFLFESPSHSSNPGHGFDSL